jgi:hypothetical protein
MEYFSGPSQERPRARNPAQRARCGSPEGLPRRGDLVFSVTGRTPISGFGKAKARLDKASGVSNWRLHDLWRTATTGMARMGFPPHVVDRILNHVSGTIRGVAAVYNRFDYLDERRRALEVWARYVIREPGANGVPQLAARGV